MTEGVMVTNMFGLGDVRVDREHGPVNASTYVDMERLYAEVYAEPPYSEGAEHVARFAEQLPGLCAGEGFTLMRAAGPAGELVGVAYGLTMPAGQWFANSSPAPPDILEDPHFVVMEWMVHRASRRRGIGLRLLTDLLSDRPEPWAVLMVNPAAAAYGIYLNHGWQRVGVLTPPPMFPPMAVLARPLGRGGGDAS